MAAISGSDRQWRKNFSLRKARIASREAVPAKIASHSRGRWTVRPCHSNRLSRNASGLRAASSCVMVMASSL